MALNLGETIRQLESVVQSLGTARAERQRRLEQLRQDARAIQPEEARRRTSEPGIPFLAAQVLDALLGAYAPNPCPQDWSALSVDGSHIDVDRHLPVPCYLLNLGGCLLTYGADSGARFFSRPHLAAGEEELYLRDPRRANTEEALTGNLLGLYRTVRELTALLEEARQCADDRPVLALVDGSLALWGLAGRTYPDFVRRYIIDEGLLPVLDGFRSLARERQVTLAAYVSLPRTTEVVNAVRRCICRFDLERCRQSCSNRVATLEPCSRANDFLDREFFEGLLPPYHRSPTYRTMSSVPRDHYGEGQQVCFYYVNVGAEIARVEVPQWVAEDDS